MNISDFRNLFRDGQSPHCTLRAFITSCRVNSTNVLYQCYTKSTLCQRRAVSPFRAALQLPNGGDRGIRGPRARRDRARGPVQVHLRPAAGAFPLLNAGNPALMHVKRNRINVHTNSSIRKQPQRGYAPSGALVLGLDLAPAVVGDGVLRRGPSAVQLRSVADPATTKERVSRRARTTSVAAKAGRSALLTTTSRRASPGRSCR